MRHLLSLVLSIILAPLIYGAAGYAAVKLDAAHVGPDIDWAVAGLGLGAGLLAGVLYALLVMSRLSPAGPMVAGLAYLGVTLWSLLQPANFASTLDLTLLNTKGVLTAPVGAGTVLLAVPLLATVFSGRRWAGVAAGAMSPYDAAPDYTTTPATAAPPYSEPPTLTTPTYLEPTYTPSYSPSYAEPTPAPAEPTTTPPSPPTAYDSWGPVYTPPGSTTTAGESDR